MHIYPREAAVIHAYPRAAAAIHVYHRAAAAAIHVYPRVAAIHVYPRAARNTVEDRRTLLHDTNQQSLHFTFPINTIQTISCRGSIHLPV